MADLTIRDVHKSFGVIEVLKGIDIQANSGEFVALVGPSGCGKSTLLALIAGLEKLTSGEIRIGERIVNSVPPKDRNIAMVFQSYALYPTMTVRENMMFGMEARGVPKAERTAAVERVSSLLQIGALLNRKPGQLSGGQRQRVAMGRALVRDPDLFLFDEPLSNLDAKLRVDMRTEIKKLHHRLGKTTIYVTHDQVEAMTLASRIAVMHLGALQQFDEPQTVYDRPANLFVAGFMGSPPMNFIPARLEDRNDSSFVTFAGNDAPISLRLPRPVAASNGNVVLGIRPEHLSRHSGTEVAPDVDVLTAKVEVVEPTGAETMVIMRLGEGELVGRFAPAQAPRMGETVKLVRRHEAGLPVRHEDGTTHRMNADFATYPSLAGKTVFVTGGASGIGADIVRAFHAQGAAVAFVDLQARAGEALSAELGERSLFLACDLVDITALQAAIAAVRERLGPIGVLVNNAANDDRHEIDAVSVDYWDWSQAINLRPHFFAAQAVRPQMRERGGGSIVNFSSIAWRGGSAQMAAYATAKAAILGLTRALARGFGPDNIRVNAIEPGAVMTEKQRQLWYTSQESVDRIVERQVLREVLTGDDIARTVLFLASDDSKMITKQSIVVDAGLA